MSISPFSFSSENLPKLKAKQLSKAFPFFKLSEAQETTARALGYSSWFECLRSASRNEPSLSDQDAGLGVRAQRFYHQANILTDQGITPQEADLWVRAWGLTGRVTLAPKHGRPTYYVWNEILEQVESGVLDENEFLEQWGDDGWLSKYPEIDRPTRICPGVIIGPAGKYPHYAVDPLINAKIPAYFRGPFCNYHIEDDTDVLAMYAPGFPKNSRERTLKRLNFVHHEWHFGTKHEDARNLYVPKIAAAALKHPEDMMIISMRAGRTKGSGVEVEDTLCDVACLKGKDFSEFLLQKGKIQPSKVVWYSDVLEPNVYGWLDCWLYFDDGSLPIFHAARDYKPSLPIYSYPFKTAPMSKDEYQTVMETMCLLPLSEDYAEDDEDD